MKGPLISRFQLVFVPCRGTFKCPEQFHSRGALFWGILHFCESPLYPLLDMLRMNELRQSHPQTLDVTGLFAQLKKKGMTDRQPASHPDRHCGQAGPHLFICEAVSQRVTYSLVDEGERHRKKPTTDIRPSCFTLQRTTKPLVSGGHGVGRNAKHWDGRRRYTGRQTHPRCRPPPT